MSLGLHDVAHLAQLVHELGVDLQPAGGVDDHDVAPEPGGFLERAARHRHRVGRLGVHRHADALAEHAQLLDRGRTLEVGADEQRSAVLALEQLGQLGRGGRLPGALQARHHHDARRLRRRRELAGGAAEGLDQLLVDDLDDLLRGAEALGDLGALRPLLHPPDEVAGDDDVDVGLEQRHPQLATDLVDLLVGELPAAAELGEDAVEAVGEGVEHGPLRLVPPASASQPARAGDVAPKRAGQASSRAATNASGSNSIRSAERSPTPMSFTGMPSSASMASTMPPLARAVELGEHHAGDVDRLGELPGLREPVLPGGRVEDEQHLLERARRAVDDAPELLELGHEVGLGVETAGGVDEHEVGVAARGRAHRVVDDRAGVGALLAAHDARRR